jgi:hypothetical protein
VSRAVLSFLQVQPFARVALRSDEDEAKTIIFSGGGRSPARREPQAFRSVIRMIATTLPSLTTCSFVSLLQVQTKFFLAVMVLPS